MIDAILHDVRQLFRKATKKILSFVKTTYFIVGQILINIGSRMVRRNNRYLFISNIIENLFGSIEILLKVTTIEEHSLFIRFVTQVASSNNNKINWDYFLKELVYQLGGSFSDINIDVVANSNDFITYNIDITKSSISHLERGTTYGRPQIFEEKNIEWLMQKAIMLSAEDNFSPELISQKMGMSIESAKELYDQLIRADAIIKKPSTRTVN